MGTILSCRFGAFACVIGMLCCIYLLYYSLDFKSDPVYRCCTLSSSDCLPDLFALWILCLHSEQHRSLGDVFGHSHIQDVHIELWGLVYVGDGHRDEGRGFAAVLQTFHQRLWVTSINLELAAGRGLKVQRLLGDKQAGIYYITYLAMKYSLLIEGILLLKFVTVLFQNTRVRNQIQQP